MRAEEDARSWRQQIIDVSTDHVLDGTTKIEAIVALAYTTVPDASTVRTPLGRPSTPGSRTLGAPDSSRRCRRPEVFADRGDRFVRMAQVRAVPGRLQLAKGAPWRHRCDVLANTLRRDRVVAALEHSAGHGQRVRSARLSPRNVASREPPRDHGIGRAEDTSQLRASSGRSALLRRPSARARSPTRCSSCPSCRAGPRCRRAQSRPGSPAVR